MLDMGKKSRYSITEVCLQMAESFAPCPAPVINRIFPIFPPGEAASRAPGQESVPMKTRPQSWREMSAAPRFFIAVVVICGLAVMTYSVMHGKSENPLKFFCYLVIALAASRLKVNIPGITGTMSVNFLFLLLGVLELSLSEAMALGCAAVVVQCFDRDRPIPIQVAFNVCSTALAIAVTFFAYRYSMMHSLVKNPSTLLFLAACVYFVSNTLPVAAVISLTEKRSLRKIWSGCYFWSFPYYLVGAG